MLTEEQIDALALRYAGGLNTGDGLRDFARACIAASDEQHEVLASHTGLVERKLWAVQRWLYQGDRIVLIKGAKI